MTTFEYVSKSLLDLGAKLPLRQVSRLFIGLDRLSVLITRQSPPNRSLPHPTSPLSIPRKGIIPFLIRVFFIFLLNHAFLVLVELGVPVLISGGPVLSRVEFPRNVLVLTFLALKGL